MNPIFRQTLVMLTKGILFGLLIWFVIWLVVQDARAGESHNKGDQKQVQNQEQLQDQLQEQSQKQNSFSSANSDQSNSQVFNVTSPDNIKIKNTPDISLGGIYPANPCHVPVQGSVSLPGFGIGGGSASIDDVCQNLEWVRVAYQMGMRDAAIWKLCSMAQAEGVPDCSPVNDYNKEVKLMQADNEAFRLRYLEQEKQIDELEGERNKYLKLLETERMQKALEK